jgi:hypothetical protein
MKVQSKPEQAEAIEYITDQLDQLPLILPNTDTVTEQPAKRRRVEIDEIDDDLVDTTQESEIAKYQSAVVPSGTCKDILLWWRDHKEEYPGLCLVARNVLCVMASSAASERNFSLAGHVVSERRTSLASSSVNNILLINSSMLKTGAKN